MSKSTMEKTKKKVTIQDLSRQTEENLIDIKAEDLMPLPPPYDKPENDPLFTELKDVYKEKYETSLDGTVAVGIERPSSKEQEELLVQKFLSGLQKLLSKTDNWTFLQPLMLTLENCAKCQTCSLACPVFESSGQQEIYRPTFRSEVLRAIIRKYLSPGGKFFGRFNGSNIDLNWKTIARLAELSYRCTLCRRCAKTCPMGLDNGLVTHELRKLFSQELGIAAKELHEKGSVQQLKVGSSTGMTKAVLMDSMEFIEDDIKEMTGLDIKMVWDKPNADVLLIHNAGEILSWPENPAAFAILFEAAGISWTMSSDLVAYDAVNYGLWYDDFQLARVAYKHVEAAKKLGVRKIIIGECGHAHKALTVVADRVFHSEYNVPRESSMTFLEYIVNSGRIKFDRERNNFPVTLHDPCNLVRLMGVVEPQRRILRKICTDFREMSPHGVDNYCCGGGSGFAIMSPFNFMDWRAVISGRMKLKQVLDVFADVIDPSINKYLCAPCSNCKGQIRDLFQYYDVWDKCRINYGGLVELMVNAMTDLKDPFIEWEWH